MRVVQVTRQFPPAIGGLEEAVLKMSAGLHDRHGIQSEIVTLDRIFGEPERRLPRHDEVDGFEVTRIPYTGSRRYPLAPGVLAAIRSADLVHVHGVDFFFDALALTSALHRKPLVASTHGGFFHTGFARRLKRAYFRTVTAASCRAYQAIYATSENDAALFRAIARDKVQTVGNGVDTAKWADRGSPTLKPRMIYFGRLSANKHVDLWLPVLRELRRSGDWTLIVAGRADDVSFDSLRDSARHHGVAEAVTFVASPSSHALAKLIGTASYYVSASEHEGFGISAVEAMSAGLIPVLSRIPAFEAFLKRAPGVLVEPQDTVATAAAITLVHDSMTTDLVRTRRDLMAVAGTYDWGTVADTIAASYRSILRGRSPRILKAVEGET